MIAAIDPNLILVAAIAAIPGSMAAVFSYFAHKNILRVEIATNSLTDRLVATTDKEAHQRGMQDQRDKDAKSTQAP